MVDEAEPCGNSRCSLMIVIHGIVCCGSMPGYSSTCGFHAVQLAFTSVASLPPSLVRIMQAPNPRKLDLH